MYLHIGNANDSTSSDAMVGSSDLFKVPATITDAYLTLIKELDGLLIDCGLSTLKLALIFQASTPGGVKLTGEEKNKITSAKSSFELLCTVDDFTSCNWLDTRLIRALARTCGSLAVKLLDDYKSYVFAKKLNEALPSFPKKPLINEFVTEVSLKINMDQDEITVNDVVNYQWAVESVILDLGNQTLNIANVKTGCLEVHCHIPIHCSFNAYEMALHNRHNFYTINLIHIEIGIHPVIHDPWFCGFGRHPVKQILHVQHEGMYINFSCYVNVLDKFYSFYRIEMYSTG